MFAALYSADVTCAARLPACAQEFSPRVEIQLGGHLVLIDIAGLGRIVGDADAIAMALRSRLASPATSHVVVAPSRIAALLLAVAEHDAVVLPGRTAAAVGALKLSVFETLANLRNQRNQKNRRHQKNQKNPTNLRNLRNLRNDKQLPCALCCLSGAPRLCGHPGGACTELPTFRRWGLSTLGDLAALPPVALSTRLGQMGVVLQRLARGRDLQPLAPIVEETRFEASIDLEWPIEDLQPLSFVLARLLDPLSGALERADRGAAAIVTELTLVRLSAPEGETRAERNARPVHARRLELPAPMRDPRVLRTLILLDLESHPPLAGIDRVTVRLDPTPGRIAQFSLLERAGPQPETIATLVSRLTALMGEGRIGSPVLLDSHAPDAFALRPFGDVAMSQPDMANSPDRQILPSPVLRRFRLPVMARVVFAGDRPVRVTTDRAGLRGGAVRHCAGPWRSSGHWWASGAMNPAAWDRDEYDVALGDGAAYRLYRDRHEDRWFIEGILD